MARFPDRRIISAGLLLTILLFTGCVLPEDSPTEPSDSVEDTLDVTMERRQSDDCSVDDFESVRLDRSADRLTVDGCIMARDGCHMPHLTDYNYDPETRSLTVRVRERDVSEPDQACTMALTERAYRVVADSVPDLRRLVVEETDVDGTRTLIRAFTDHSR